MFAAALAANFRILGVTATYTPAGGSTPFTVKVQHRSPDTVQDTGLIKVQRGTSVFDVLKADVALPKKGDQLTVDGVAYEVVQNPMALDGDRLIWVLTTDPVAV